MRPKYLALIPCYEDRLPLNREHAEGCWNCPHRDLCPDAMTDTSELCGMLQEVQDG